MGPDLVYCHVHGEDEIYFNHSEGEYYCLACDKEDEIEDTFKYGL